MESLFNIYQGRVLPDFSAPILIVAAIEYEKVSRSERFIIHQGKVIRRGAQYRWADDWGLELQKMWSAERLMDFEVAQATELIESDLRTQYAYDPQIARTYCPYVFDKIADATPFLMTKQLLSQLPSLKLFEGSRCVDLRNLAQKISRMKPLVLEIDDTHWYDDGN